MIILRRKVARTPEDLALGQSSQLFLDWKRLFPVRGPVYEYAALVTSLTSEILTVAQLHRDRADMENNLDELMNQWGWCGYVTQDLLRCQIAARHIAVASEN